MPDAAKVKTQQFTRKKSNLVKRADQLARLCHADLALDQVPNFLGILTDHEWWTSHKNNSESYKRSFSDSIPLMSAIFCYSSISSYRLRQLDQATKFRTFMGWASLQTTFLVPVDGSLVSSAPYAIQLVRQIKSGQQESIRYFLSASNGSDCLCWRARPSPPSLSSKCHIFNAPYNFLYNLLNTTSNINL